MTTKPECQKCRSIFGISKTATHAAPSLLSPGGLMYYCEEHAFDYAQMAGRMDTVKEVQSNMFTATAADLRPRM